MAVRSLRKKPSGRYSANLRQPPRMASPFSTFPGPFLRPLLVVLVVSLFVIPLYMLSKSAPALGAHGSAHIYSIEVVNEFPHDRQAFTQGLLYGGNNILYESTGLYGRSSVREVDLHTGKVQVLQKMDGSYFGEGLTLLDDRLFQLTWLRNIGFIYDRDNLSYFERFTHQMQDGWGLATDGKVLFGSDGTSALYQIDPQTLKVIGKQTVKYKDHEVHNLNELEFVNGEVWANVFQTDCIAIISHKDGVIRGWVVLSKLREGLIAGGERGIDVLNGIAWDNSTNRIFVTGKLWPRLYEIKVRQVVRKPVEGAIKDLCIREPFRLY